MLEKELRYAIEDYQEAHPEFGDLYHLLHDVRDVIVERAFDKDNTVEDYPLISLEANPTSRQAGTWRAKFQEVGPLGFKNVVSLNLMGFRHGAEIPESLAHELCHWFDRPNTGHTDSFWWHMKSRVGIDRNGMKNMAWVRLEEFFPMEDLSAIALNP